MSTVPGKGSADRLLEDGYRDEGSAQDGSAQNELDPADDSYWVSRASSAFGASSSWFESSVRSKVEDSMRLFNSRHPKGSKYRTQQYDKRSKLFRPKTRSSIRKLEAAAAAAFFATEDAVAATPPNPRDPMQRLAAEVNGELLNYRLQNDIPWYLTVLGAVQDAAKQGVVISKQEWVYKEVDEVYEETMSDDITGEVLGTRNVYDKKVVRDHPDVRLVPIENCRFSPAADWRNPVQTSPYFIEMEPYFVGDVKTRMRDNKRKGDYDVDWRMLTDGEIRSAMRQSYDPVRQAREGTREDRYDDAETALLDHEVVWVHHNYMTIEGEEWYFCTLGTEMLLTDPVPLNHITPLEERPYTMGFAVLETHKPYPASLVELGRPLQEEVNDVTNKRMDNIDHILSPRYFIRRGTSIDIRSLLRNVPGGVTAMEDPNQDVHIRQIADVTGSAYEEQDRLSIEMDELTGAFSQSTVASNQNVNERVGNTQMLGEAANQITEMTIRMVSETWVEPTLNQIMRLEQALESDPVVLAIVGERQEVSPESVFRFLNMPVRIKINVGFGATNPQVRIQKVAMAFQTLGEIRPDLLQDADAKELAGEILGAVGFKSVERFFPGMAGSGQSPEQQQIEQLKGEIEQLQQIIESKQAEKQAEGQVKIQVAQVAAQSREKIEMAKLQYMKAKDMTAQELSMRIEQNKAMVAQLDYEIRKEQNGFRRQELVQQRIALNHTITMDERQFRLEQRRAMMDYQRGAIDVDAEPDNPPPTSDEGNRMDMTPAPKLGGDDKAGVMARGNYGAIPYEEG